MNRCWWQWWRWIWLRGGIESNVLALTMINDVIFYIMVKFMLWRLGALIAVVVIVVLLCTLFYLCRFGSANWINSQCSHPLRCHNKLIFIQTEFLLQSRDECKRFWYFPFDSQNSRMLPKTWRQSQNHANKEELQKRNGTVAESEWKIDKIQIPVYAFIKYLVWKRFWECGMRVEASSKSINSLTILENKQQKISPIK